MTPITTGDGQVTETVSENDQAYGHVRVLMTGETLVDLVAQSLALAPQGNGSEGPTVTPTHYYVSTE